MFFFFFSVGAFLSEITARKKHADRVIIKQTLEQEKKLIEMFKKLTRTTSKKNWNVIKELREIKNSWQPNENAINDESRFN